MGKKVAIVQSNYIPWKGYFDLINSVDDFILFDNVQYTKRDWRNRNFIKAKNGVELLTIPVIVKGKYKQKIRDVKTTGSEWRKKHWKTIVHNYSKAVYFKDFREIFDNLYLGNNDESLSEINWKFINAICEILGIETKILQSMDYEIVEGKNERLISLCKQVNATEYISGPSAIGYIDKELFNKEDIKVSFFEYSEYPEYNQLYPPFEHLVSIIDLIFNEGPKANYFMKSFK